MIIRMQICNNFIEHQFSIQRPVIQQSFSILEKIQTTKQKTFH